MRGKPKRFVVFDFLDRITPAHAGKTISPISLETCLRDHPHACGENSVELELHGADEGSPPRMRGKLLFGSGHFVVAGITPAHAGKTQSDSRGGVNVKDHPRACGENPSASSSFIF